MKRPSGYMIMTDGVTQHDYKRELNKYIDYLESENKKLILSGVSNHVVCDECGNTGRGRPTLQEPDGVDCEKCSSK